MVWIYQFLYPLSNFKLRVIILGIKHKYRRDQARDAVSSKYDLLLFHDFMSFSSAQRMILVGPRNILKPVSPLEKVGEV